MSSRDLVPIHDNLATGLQHQTLYANVHKPFATKCKVFGPHNTVYVATYVLHTYVCMDVRMFVYSYLYMCL